MTIRKRTALIVDDEETMLDIEAFMLQKIGFNILKARNSAEACKLFADEKDSIDIVVLDMVMPQEHGSITYKRLKKMNPAIRVLVASAFEKDGIVDSILNDGQNGFIQKPFKFEDFVRNIDLILSS